MWIRKEARRKKRVRTRAGEIARMITAWRLGVTGKDSIDEEEGEKRQKERVGVGVHSCNRIGYGVDVGFGCLLCFSGKEKEELESMLCVNNSNEWGFPFSIYVEPR